MTFQQLADWFMGKDQDDSSAVSPTRQGRQPSPYEEQLEAERRQQAALERAQRAAAFGEGLQAFGSAAIWIGISILFIGLVVVPLLLA